MSTHTKKVPLAKIHLHAHTHTHTVVNTDIQKHEHTCAHTQRKCLLPRSTCMHAHTQKHTFRHKYTHKYAFTNTHTHTDFPRGKHPQHLSKIHPNALFVNTAYVNECVSVRVCVSAYGEKDRERK